MLYYLVATLYVLTCLVLMLVVLIQQGKGGDLASAFGGGSSQAAFGARAGATLLTKVTWVCAGLFVVGALALSVVGQRGPASVLGSVPLPKAPAHSAPAAPKPAAPQPAAPQTTPQSSAPAQQSAPAPAPAPSQPTPPKK
jgi:preprotein translocase subunit SecG